MDASLFFVFCIKLIRDAVKVMPNHFPSSAERHFFDEVLHSNLFLNMEKLSILLPLDEVHPGSSLLLLHKVHQLGEGIVVPSLIIFIMQHIGRDTQIARQHGRQVVPLHPAEKVCPAGGRPELGADILVPYPVVALELPEMVVEIVAKLTEALLGPVVLGHSLGVVDLLEFVRLQMVPRYDVIEGVADEMDCLFDQIDGILGDIVFRFAGFGVLVSSFPSEALVFEGMNVFNVTFRGAVFATAACSIAYTIELDIRISR